MKIVIQAKNLKLNQALRRYLREKINSLEKFSEMFQDEKKYYGDFFGKGKPKVEAWVEIEKATFHHRKGLVFQAECQMRFPGKSIRSTILAEDLRLAIDQVKDELQRQLKQYKNKLTAKKKRKERALKRETHLSSLSRFYRKGRIQEEGI